MSHATEPPPVTAPPEVDQQQATIGELSRLLSECTSLRAAYRVGLRFIAEKFASPYAALQLDVDGGTVEEHVGANASAEKSWTRSCEGLMLGARYHQVSQARFFRSQGVDQRFAVLTVPLTNSRDGAVGAIGAVVACNRRDIAKARLSELEAIAAIIDLQAEARRSNSRPSEVSSALSKVAAYESLGAFCFALANNLKSNLGCDQVALGLVRGKSVELACISGFDDLYPRSPGSQFIQQAMCECLDAGDITCFQATSDRERGQTVTGHFLHKKWSASSGAAPVASIPLYFNGSTVAIVSVRNPTDQPFSQQRLKKVQELVAPMSQGLLLLERANRSAARRAREHFSALAASLVEPGSLRRKLLVGFFLAVAAWVVFGTISYRPAASCIVQPTDELQLSAPFEGTVADSFVQSGDSVSAGQVLARMDTHDLDTERGRLLSELRRAEVTTTKAAQAGDLSGAALAHAEAAIASAQLELIEKKLAAAVLRAPEDGVILEGRLQLRLGEVVPLGTPLMKFAPRGRWKVDVHVPDHLAIQIEEGQVAELAVSARPEVVSPVRIDRVHAASTVEAGKNVFTAEASFEETPPEWMRAGMVGVTRVDVGRRPVWWVWAHRVVDALRLQFWSM